MENQKPPTFSAERDSANSLIYSVPGVETSIQVPVSAPKLTLAQQILSSVRRVIAEYRWQLILLASLVTITLIGAVYLFVSQNDPSKSPTSSLQPSSKFSVQDVALRGVIRPDTIDLSTIQALSINGQLRANNSLVLAPTTQPNASSASVGQVYFDRTGNALAYYNGTQFISVAGTNDLDALRADITAVNTRISAIPPVQAIPTAVSIPSDLATLGATNNFTSINTFSAGLAASSLTAGTLTTTGNTSLQGSLAVTGNTTLGPTTASSLVLTSPLDVASGGTGASSFTANGVLIGQGTSPVTSLAAGAGNLCLMSNAGNTGLEFDACPGGSGSGVTSLNGIDGTLTLANATGVGTTITIDDASATNKGIASFNATNFSVTAGSVNTIQNIGTGASPTFAGITANSLASALNTNLTLNAAGTGNLYLTGYDCSASGGGGKLTVDATGQVICGADGDTDTTGITTITAGNGITITGVNNTITASVRTGFGVQIDSNGIGLTDSCLTNEILKRTAGGWACGTDTVGTGDGVGATTVGTFDGGTANANGATITGTNLFLQSASGTNPGLINTGTQTFAGAKTFNGAVTLAGGATVTGNITASGTVNGATISGGTLSAGSFTGGSVSGGTVSGGTITGGTLSAAAVNGLDVSGTAVTGSGALTVASALNTNLTLNAAGTGNLYLTGYDCSASGGGGKLTVDATGQVICGADGDTDTTGITTITAGNGIDISGANNTIAAKLATGAGIQAGASGLSLLTTCTVDQVLKYNTTTGWYCANDTVGGGDGVGVTTVGTIDSQTKHTDGAVISGSTIYLQNADATNVGLVSAGAQTFGGVKTFNASAVFAGGLSVSSGQSLTIGSVCTAGQVLSTNISGVLTCVTDSEGTDTNTTYTAGSGLSLIGTQFSANIRSGFGLQADSNGIALLETCTENQILKRSLTGWVCGSDGEGADTGVTTVGALDGRTKSASGAVIDGTAIYLQTADASNPGLVSTGTQTFAGNKTFSGNTLVAGASLEVQATGGANLFNVDATGYTLAVGQASSNDNLGSLSSPSQLPTGTAVDTAFSPNGQYMVVGHSLSPYISIYKRSGDTFTKLADPATLPPGRADGVAFSSDSQYMAVSHTTSPFISIYKRSGDTFTKLADPSSLPGADARSVAFSSDNQYLVVGTTVSPFIAIYKRSGDTFTKLADPASIPAGWVYSVEFSPDGQYLALAVGTSPRLVIYKRSGDTFTKLTDPTSLPAGTSEGVSWSPDGQHLAITSGFPPFINIYKRSGDTFTKLTDPATMPTSYGRDVAYSPDGQYLSVAHNTSPYITVYKRSNDTYTKLPNPGTLPGGDSYGVAWSPDNQYMIVLPNTSPNISVYKVGNGQAVNVTINGLLNGSNASFSGLMVSGAAVLQNSLLVQGATVINENLSVGGGLTVGGSSSFTGTVTVTSASGLTLGAAASTPGILVLATSGAGSVTIQSAAQAADVALSIPTNANTTDTLCLQTLANCSGSGVTISGTATDGTLTKFNASGQIMNSNLSEASTTLAYSGNALINAATGFTGNLLDLQLNGVSQLAVNDAGNLTTTGTINTATITGGSLTSTSVNGLAVSGTAVTGSGALAITSATNTNLTLQGGGTGVISLNDDVTLSGSLTYGGASAGLLVANTSGVVSKLSAANGLCLLSQGSGQAAIFDVCPSSVAGSGQWTQGTGFLNPTTTTNNIVLGNGSQLNANYRLQSFGGAYIRDSSISAGFAGLKVDDNGSKNMLSVDYGGATNNVITIGDINATAKATDISMYGQLQFTQTGVGIQFQDGTTMTTASNAGGWSLQAGYIAQATTSNNVVLGNSGQLNSSYKLQSFGGAYFRDNNSSAVAGLKVDDNSSRNMLSVDYGTTDNVITVGDLTNTKPTKIAMYGQLQFTQTGVGIQFQDGTTMTTASNAGGWSLQAGYIAEATVSDNVVLGSMSQLNGSYKLQSFGGAYFRDNTSTAVAGLKVDDTSSRNMLSVDYGVSNNVITVGDSASSKTTNISMYGQLQFTQAGVGIQFQDGSTMITASNAGGWSLQAGYIAQATVSDNVVLGSMSQLNGSYKLQSFGGAYFRDNNSSAVAGLKVDDNSSRNMLSVDYGTSSNVITVGDSTGTPKTTNISMYGQLLFTQAGVGIQFQDGTTLTSASNAGGWSLQTGYIAQATTSNNVVLGNSGQLNSSYKLQSFGGAYFRDNTSTAVAGLKVDDTSSRNMLSVDYGVSNNVITVGDSASSKTTNISMYGQLQFTQAGVGIQFQDGSTMTGANISLIAGGNINIGGSSGIGRTCAAGQTLNGITVVGGVVTAGTCTTNGADLAESYKSVDALVAGEIVSVDGSNYPGVKRSSGVYDQKLMGIVSTQPKEVLGDDDSSNDYPIALTGRVPTKVNLEGGVIRAGDKITSSSVPGVGMKATGQGMTVGTALQDYDGTGTPVIQVFVEVGYYEASQAEILQANSAEFADLNVSGTANIDKLVVNNVIVQGSLTVSGTLTTQSILVNGHIVSGGSTPSVTAESATCNALAAAVDGTDTAGTITVTTSGSCSGNDTLVTLTFASEFSKAPRVTLTAANAKAATVQAYVDSDTASGTGFAIGATNALSNGTTYKWYYQVIE